MHPLLPRLVAAIGSVLIVLPTQVQACGGGGYRVARSHQSAWHPRIARVVRQAPQESREVAKASETNDHGSANVTAQSESSSIALKLVDAKANQPEPIKTATADAGQAKNPCTRYFPAVGMTLAVACE